MRQGVGTLWQARVATFLPRRKNQIECNVLPTQSPSERSDPSEAQAQALGNYFVTPHTQTHLHTLTQCATTAGQARGVGEGTQGNRVFGAADAAAVDS